VKEKVRRKDEDKCIDPATLILPIQIADVEVVLSERTMMEIYSGNE
jgi:hypothetical protein